jgi:ABC-type polysaccharide/polyol phosphate export permease
MNSLKQYLGIVWMLLSPVVIVLMLWQAITKINAATATTKANISLQWFIILLVFIPICIGLFLFGKYAWNKEYND